MNIFQASGCSLRPRSKISQGKKKFSNCKDSNTSHELTTSTSLRLDKLETTILNPDRVRAGDGRAHREVPVPEFRGQTLECGTDDVIRYFVTTVTLNFDLKGNILI